ncbi:GPP34 family phosphoprotein [Saccharicrinis sp. FJH2]|uniref:GPP34 family phosphoprotein n=1 Tax=Saccharicrinis sp. FJH65 TaxID=3344659 RepID=UPI0035F2EEAA
MDLSTIEKFYILTNYPLKAGWTINSKAIGAGIISSVFIDLIQEKSIEISNNKIFSKTTNTELGNLHKDILSRINGKSRQLKISTWITRLMERSDRYKKEIRQSLYSKELFEIKQGRFLLFKWEYKKLKKEIISEVLDHLRSIIFKGRIPDQEDYPILTLLYLSESFKVICSNNSEYRYCKEKLSNLVQKNRQYKKIGQIIEKIRNAANQGGIALAAGN